MSFKTPCDDVTTIFVRSVVPLFTVVFRVATTGVVVVRKVVGEVLTPVVGLVVLDFVVTVVLLVVVVVVGSVVDIVVVVVGRVVVVVGSVVVVAFVVVV